MTPGGCGCAGLFWDRTVVASGGAQDDKEEQRHKGSSQEPVVDPGYRRPDLAQIDLAKGDGQGNDADDDAIQMRAFLNADSSQATDYNTVWQRWQLAPSYEVRLRRQALQEFISRQPPGVAKDERPW